ncbi:MAG: RdgB/HAM1 family non-canonical purine NTP pyrophosphatase [Deferribacteraceae bacterium]|nr:RdgB/HAM1 family non-canonical purine NTP pyrophosphatase [Deferribacteraceae bacterium]
MKVYVASGNAHKVAEFQQILAGIAFVEPYPSFASMNVEETGSTFEENACIKAVALSQLIKDYVIADDSGIEVKALDGAPGIYSARYASSATDVDNNALLLQNLAGKSDRAARFVSVIALARAGEIVQIFRGECTGIVGTTPRGTNGFGYDPLFLLPDGRSMAELSADEKNAISHRRRAAEKLAAYLIENQC